MAEPVPRPKLGDILIRLQLIDDAQVQAALLHQAKSGRLFGESLLDLGFIGQDDLSWALSSQLGLPYVAVGSDMADPELLAQFPQEFMRRNLVLPLVASETSLSVVLADPTDRAVLARLERIAGRELSVAVGTPSAIRTALQSVFGSEGDPLGPELRKLPDRTPPASLSSPELATLVDRALTQGANLVHLDPDGEVVKVRFRGPTGTLEDGGPFSPAALRDLVGGLTHWVGEGAQSAPGISVWGETPEQAENLPFRVIALSSAGGTSVTLVLEGLSRGKAEIAPACEEEWTRLDDMLRRPNGLLLGVAPTTLGGEELLGRLMKRFELGNRRAFAFVGPEFSLPEGVLRFGGPPTVAAAEGVARLEGVDVLAGVFPDPAVLGPLALAAARDRLVIAIVPGNGALGFVAHLLETGFSATLLSECLLAVVAQQLLPAAEAVPARAITETLFVERPLRRALQDGGEVEDLRQAAREQDFIEIGDRVRNLDQVDPALRADLERHRYLEDAA